MRRKILIIGHPKVVIEVVESSYTWVVTDLKAADNGEERIDLDLLKNRG